MRWALPCRGLRARHTWQAKASADVTRVDQFTYQQVSTDNNKAQIIPWSNQIRPGAICRGSRRRANEHACHALPGTRPEKAPPHKRACIHVGNKQTLLNGSAYRCLQWPTRPGARQRPALSSRRTRPSTSPCGRTLLETRATKRVRSECGTLCPGCLVPLLSQLGGFGGQEPFGIPRIFPSALSSFPQLVGCTPSQLHMRASAACLPEKLLWPLQRPTVDDSLSPGTSASLTREHSISNLLDLCP